MSNISLQVQPQTALRLKKILALYLDQEAFAQNIIAYQIHELNKAILNLQLDLKEFELQYRQSSAEFYDEFLRGHLGDQEAYILWAGLYEMLIENQQRLASLR
ncbi:MAG: hypothetical protein JXA33_29070 [Anaerolineae bacterium]|nr:hypothetical protein [Anaerolineae bacterium]